MAPMRTLVLLLVIAVGLAAAIDVQEYKNARMVASMRKAGKEVLPLEKQHALAARGDPYSGYYGYGYGPPPGVDVPDEWTCVPSYYGSLDGCDCNCGVYDPDCEVDGQSVFGCFPPEGEIAICDAPGVCVFETVDVPPEWTCNVQYYNTNDGCDCNCGVLDPDCLISEQFVFGCNAGVDPTCVAPGVCEYALPVPSGWVCPVSFYGTGDGCDCNCGRPDPDCSLPADAGGAILNCPCDTMTCTAEAGFCEGECDGFIITAKTIAESTAPPITDCQPFIVQDDDDNVSNAPVVLQGDDDDDNECDCSQCPGNGSFNIVTDDDDDDDNDNSNAAAPLAASLAAVGLAVAAVL